MPRCCRGSRTGSWMARLSTGYLETPGDPGPREGRRPGIIQRAGTTAGGQARNVAVESAGAVPVTRAQQGATSQHARSLPLSR